MKERKVGAHIDDDQIEVPASIFDEVFIIQIHHIEHIEIDVRGVSGLEGRSGGDPTIP